MPEIIEQLILLRNNWWTKKYIPARLEPRHNKADNQKAFKILGWKPEVKLEDGIKELIELENRCFQHQTKERQKKKNSLIL